MSKYFDGDTVCGKVTGIEEYGIFLSFDDGSSGLVHISEISDNFVKDINDYAKIGDDITVKVLSVEDDNHYKLSIKALCSLEKNNMDKYIKETSNGFETLRTKLDEWVNEFDLKN